MTFQIGLTLAILIVTLVLLAGRRMRPDLAVLCATLALILTGILSPAEAFSALGQALIIIKPGVYVVGVVMHATGVATLLANRLQGMSSEGPAALGLRSCWPQAY